MADEIINRVAQNTNLQTIDLEELYPDGKRVLFDIADWLTEGLILREKDFRAAVSEHNWSQYENAYVALHCSTDAIVPSWAYMLISVQLAPYVEKMVVGNLNLLETSIFQQVLNDLDLSQYHDKFVIIKGCSQKPVPESAYIQLTQALQPHAKSIMFGEACSSVPLFKRKK